MIDKAITSIKTAALLLPDASDTLRLDRMLGELDLLIHDARLLIDAEWRDLREAALAARQGSAIRNLAPTLDDIA